MSEPEDLIQLHPDLQTQWNYIVKHYDDIGLSHSQHPIWDVSFRQFSAYPEYEPSVFIFDNDRNYRWQEVVKFINSKNNFISLAQELDVKVPQTICVESKSKLPSVESITFPCYVKPAISVDGVGISRVGNAEEFDLALNILDDDTPLQIQQEVLADKFLNLQYLATTESVEPFAATEQILDGFAHSGNRYPTAYQPWSLVEPMAQWMWEKGMQGIFAFDVAVVERDSSIDYLAIECNPRFNGASYPTGIARKLNIDSWSSETFTTEYRSLQDIELQDLEYDTLKGNGVIMVNWGSILVGKLGVLLAGSLSEQDRLRSDLKNRLKATTAIKNGATAPCV
jgi:hypothetical protein